MTTYGLLIFDGAEELDFSGVRVKSHAVSGRG